MMWSITRWTDRGTLYKVIGLKFGSEFGNAYRNREAVERPR